MFADFLFAFNAVVPIFVVAAVGFILKNTGFLTDEFVKVTDKFVFKVLLPCLLFTKVAYIKITDITKSDLKVLGFCLVSAIVITVLFSLIVPLFIKDKAKVGAFVQGVFRSNVAFLGIPFAISLFGDEGGRICSIVLSAIVPLYNVLAVIVLCLFAPDKQNNSVSLVKRLAGVLKGIITNPLIIGIVLAMPFAIFSAGDYIPKFVTASIDYFAKASTTLALVTIGASFSIKELSGRLGMAVSATVLKTAIIPAVFLVMARHLFGFSGVHLGIILVVFGTPTAISSYIMAKNMDSDAFLANQIVLLTTLASMFTIFLFSFVMKSIGLF